MMIDCLVIYGRYRKSIEDEKAARARAEQLHNENAKQINDNLEKMRSEFQQKEEARNKRIADLEKQLQAEKNKPVPAPQRRRRRGGCVVM